ncbi:hypothetical protein BH23ACT5_BH23ACT5_13520 [soil metagenome]
MSDPLDLVSEALSALGRGDGPAARAAIATAVADDKALEGVADAVDVAASHLEAGEEMEASMWNALADACPSELRSVVEASRS